MDSTIQKDIWPIKDLLQEKGLVIPNYQRPYKWKIKHITALLEDLDTQINQQEYRLGTIIFHSPTDATLDNRARNPTSHDSKTPILNIVDGQQRTLTLMLIVWNFLGNETQKLELADEKLTKEELDEVFLNVDNFIKKQKFYSSISSQNIYNNNLEIIRWINTGRINKDHIHFLLCNCKVVIFVLDELSEAF